MEEHVEWKKPLLSFENSMCNMKKETQNVACDGDLKYMAIAKTLPIRFNHGKGAKRGKNKISVTVELNSQ